MKNQTPHIKTVMYVFMFGIGLIKKFIMKQIKNNTIRISSIGEPALHWYNIKRKEHKKHSSENYDVMINTSFLPIYDDGFCLLFE